jgi:hypothetical protein
MDVLQLRCSALPLAFLCAGSVRPGELAINETSDAAEMGTCAHEGLATLVETGRVDWDGVPSLARKHDADEGELRMLLANGAKLWALVKDSFPSAVTEVELSHTWPVLGADGGIVTVTLTGHADILGRSADVAHVGDHKTGRNDSDYAEQIRGYAALALLADHTLTAATAGVLWVRDVEYEHHSMSRVALLTWIARLEAEIVRWDGTYRPGPHCAHCPRNHECPAANAMVRRDVAAIADHALVAQVENETALLAMPPEEIVEVLGKADMVTKYAERVRAAIRAHVIRHGDVVGAGKRLTLQTEERRRLITLAAFPVLEAAGFDDDEMGQVIDISAAKAEKIVSARAGKGNGASAVRALRASLDEAQAIQTDTVTKLVTKRA